MTRMWCVPTGWWGLLGRWALKLTACIHFLSHFCNPISRCEAMASGCCPKPSRYDQLTLQTWFKLNQSFKLLLVRHLVIGKGNQPIEPAPKSALFSSSFHTLMSGNTIHSPSRVDIDCSIYVLVSYASSLRPHCLWPPCLIHYGWLLPSCKNSLLPRVFMAVNTWISMHQYRWLLPMF